ncbi:hypothetical protein CDAR_119071 [Caerostris darwini]|uniref:Uncharacterized protein n=1 Tax=Caerostris darwini TaxID=1538125 RepID=A0AAV4VAU8_9ARAC|nr:hypothetical protein CDAR_119071 [Caerostris darwini]
MVKGRSEKLSARPCLAVIAFMRDVICRLQQVRLTFRSLLIMRPRATNKSSANEDLHVKGAARKAFSNTRPRGYSSHWG